MSAIFNAEEIFEIAERIERNGAKFYRRVADMAVFVASRTLMLDLAGQEDDHEKTFAAMRADMPGQTSSLAAAFDPDDQAALYLQAIADGHVFDVKLDPAERLSGRETPEEVLTIAIGLEKDSIIFYHGIKALVPEHLGQANINDIITEEMAHVINLSEELAAVKKR